MLVLLLTVYSADGVLSTLVFCSTNALVYCTEHYSTKLCHPLHYTVLYQALSPAALHCTLPSSVTRCTTLHSTKLCHPLHYTVLYHALSNSALLCDSILNSVVFFTSIDCFSLSLSLLCHTLTPQTTLYYHCITLYSPTTFCVTH